jgi:hypothetical protein
MTAIPSYPSGSALRERMIEDMSMRGFTEATRRDYIRCVKAFAAFIGRSPEMATAELSSVFATFEQHLSYEDGYTVLRLTGWAAVCFLRMESRKRR